MNIVEYMFQPKEEHYGNRLCTKKTKNKKQNTECKHVMYSTEFSG